MRESSKLPAGLEFVPEGPWKLVCMYFIIYTGQMFLMDRFFDGTFLTFGIEVISFAERDQEDRIDPMVRQLIM